MRTLLIATVLVIATCGPACQADSQTIPEYGCQVIHVYPHDPMAFTEGLFFLNGYLYESTGEWGQSSIRKVKLETGEVLMRYDMPPQFFGEGIIAWNGRIIQLTWQSQVGFIYGLKSFERIREFHYPGEGWALTEDGHRIIMSDGTPQIRFWNPETLAETERITVTASGLPLKNINELEWVKGEILANVWQTDRIARINPSTGKVVGWINCSGLLTPNDHVGRRIDVFNGIAYDSKADRLFVTGKYWPKLFEIKVVKIHGK